ncbi:MAG: DNA repair protein RecO [Spirochaetaceae bacterium]
MARNRHTPGIILTSRRFGEYHKDLHILTPEEGVIRATAFGALKGKSRLSGVTEPFTEGEMYLYHDPVKDRLKLSEVDTTDAHEGIRGELRRYYIASFWVEFVIKSYGGGGEYSSLYRLLGGAFHTLENTELLDAVNIHFIWRYLALIGFRPDADSWDLDPWARDFLKRSAVTPFSVLEEYLEEYLEEAAHRTSPAHGASEAESLIKLKATVLRLVQEVVERPLNTLSQGIL